MAHFYIKVNAYKRKSPLKVRQGDCEHESRQFFFLGKPTFALVIISEVYLSITKFVVISWQARNLKNCQ
jgi:hypothetical protein